MESSNIHLVTEKVRLSIRVLPPKGELQHAQDTAVEHALHRERRFLSIASTDINLAKLTNLLEVEWKEKYIPQAHHGNFYIDRLRDRYENDLDPDYRLEEILLGYPEPHIIKVVTGHIDRQSSIPVCSKFRNICRNDFRSPSVGLSEEPSNSPPTVEIGVEDLHDFPFSSPKRKREYHEDFDTPIDSQSYKNIKVESGITTYSKRIGRTDAPEDQFDINNILKENADHSCSRKRMRNAHSSTCSNYPEHISIRPPSPSNIHIVKEPTTVNQPSTRSGQPQLVTPPSFNSYKAAKKRKLGSDVSSPLEQRSKRQKSRREGSRGHQHPATDIQNDSQFFSKRSSPTKIKFKIEPQAGIETVSSSPEIVHVGPRLGNTSINPIDLTSPSSPRPQVRRQNTPAQKPLPRRAMAKTLNNQIPSLPVQPFSRADELSGNYRPPQRSQPISISPSPKADANRLTGGASPVLDSSPPPQPTPRLRSDTAAAANTVATSIAARNPELAAPEAKARSVPALKWRQERSHQSAGPAQSAPPVVKKEPSDPDWPPRSQRELLAALSIDESSSGYDDSDDL